MNEIIGKCRELYNKSDFARESFALSEALSYLAEWQGVEFDPIILPALTSPQRECVLEAFEKAVNGYPLQYIVGKARFYKSDFTVREGVLIPRRDSETLVEEAVKRIPQGSHFLDLCTGSGCLGISVLVERPDTTATLVDISDTALETAEENARALGVLDRCRLLKFDLLSRPISELPDHTALIMNPPYLTSLEMTKIPMNVAYEPSLALDGGEDGLIFYRLFEKHTGLMLFEIGSSQAEDLKKIYPKSETVYDLCRNPRVVVIS